MAELTRVTAVFTAEFSQLIRGFREATGAATSAAQRISRQFRKVGRDVQQVGRDMTTYLTGSLAAVAGASTKFSADFETSLQSIVGLVGVAQEQVDAWRDDLLRLGPEVGKTPIELADALYFITSAGVDASQAMDVLRASAKAAAAGLGETSTVAKTVSAAVNTWGDVGLTAAEATDILVAAVNKGNVEAPELASSLGRVFGVAKEAGATFRDVAAGVAVMTIQGISAAEAVTSLNGLFSLMLGSGTQAAQALDEIGLSSSALRESLANDGLLETLRLLISRSDGTSESLKLMIPNIRALRGILSITGQDAQKVTDIFAAMDNALGETNRAFAAMVITTNFKFKAAIASLQSVLIVLGDILKSSVNAILDRTVIILRAVTEWLGNLTPEAQRLVVTMGAIAAAIGPILLGFGLFLRIAGATLAAVVAFSRGAIAAVRGVARAVVALGTAFTSLPVIMGLGLAAAIGAAALFRRTIITFFEGLGKAVGFAFEQDWRNNFVRPFYQSLNEIVTAINDVFNFDITPFEVPDAIIGDPLDKFREALAAASAQADKDIQGIREMMTSLGEGAREAAEAVLPKGLIDLLFGGEDGDVKTSIEDMEKAVKVANDLINGVTAGGDGGKVDKKKAEAIADAMRNMRIELGALSGAFGDLKPETVAFLADLDLIKVKVDDAGKATFSLGSGAEAVAEMFERVAAATAARDLIDETATAQEAYNKKVSEYIQLLLDGDITLETYERAVRAAKDELDDFARTITGDVNTAAENFAITLNKLNELWREGTISAETYNRAVKKARDELNATEKDVEDTSFTVKDLGLVFTSAFEDAAIAGTDLRTVLQGLAQDLEKLALRKLVTEPIFKAVGGIDIGSLIGSVFGASGGVPTGDTTAGFSQLLSRHGGGQVRAGDEYIVGEHGPERFRPSIGGRILPNDGSGGGGRTVVNVYAPPGSETRQERQQTPDGERLNIYIDQATARNIRPGTKTFRAMSRQFNVAPRVIER